MKIEKNVPVPTSRGKYPFEEMDVGDSVFIGGTHPAGKEMGAARYHGKTTGKKFVCRSGDGGIRIWRIK